MAQGNRLKLFRFVEDAWEDGLREWCRAASGAALDGVQSWFIAAAAGQVYWLKERALREGLTLFGIRFLSPGALRFELCALLGVPAAPLGGETLEFLLKLEAMRRVDPESLSQARAPGALLKAVARLRAAGWQGGAGNLPISSHALRTLESSRAWGPALDDELLFQAGMAVGLSLRTCFFAWDAAHWEHLSLFEAAARASSSCESYQPMPRPPAEALQQGWIKAVEARLKTGHEICGESGFSSANEALVSRLEGVDLEASVPQPPRFLIGRDWGDEVALVRDCVLERLATLNAGERLGVIVSRRSPSSLEIVRTLADAGIPLFDETKENQEPEAVVAIQLQVIRYHLLGCDAEELVRLIDLLNDLPSDAWTWFSRERARRDLLEGFASLQTRNARLLVHGFENPEGPSVVRLAGLVEALGSWEGKMTWAGAREKWERCLRGFGLGVESLEPNWSLVAELAGASAPMEGAAFLEYLQAILSAGKTERAKDADANYAAVTVTTFSQAWGRAWDGLIFFDSNEGQWPVKPEENPFLDDALCRTLNARKSARQGYLLDSNEQSAVEQSHFLDLLENCRGEVAFAAVSRSDADASRDAYPNEWVIRALVESAPGEGTRLAILDSWRKAVAICRKPRPRLGAEDRRHLERVHADRRDPALPFDEYLFNFGGSSFVSGKWSPAELDAAAISPATFALRKILGAESAGNGEFLRNERHAVGRRVHRWLGQALGGGADFAPFEYSPEARRALKEAARQTERDLADRFRMEGATLPLWWKSALRKAVWNAWACLPPLAGLQPGRFFAMEYTILREVATDGGNMKLEGRIDLLLADRPLLEDAALEVIDFKTGRAAPPTLSTLDRGKGFQFAAYFLMMKAAGASSVDVEVVRPKDGLLTVFRNADERELRRKLGGLARMQRGLDFGQLGPMVAQWTVCETLPMATTPISPRTLERKAALRENLGRDFPPAL